MFRRQTRSTETMPDTVGESAGEVSQVAESDASMPLGPGFPRAGVSITAEETDESDSVEVHTFLLFCPSVSGTRKRVGAAPKTRSCFSGGTGTGEPEPERGRRQSRGFAGAGRRTNPEAVPRQRVEEETDRKQVRDGSPGPAILQAQREVAVNELSAGIEADVRKRREGTVASGCSRYAACRQVYRW